MPAPLAAKPPVTETVLFVDGISRSGKKLTCKIVSHLERVDYFQYVSLIENLAYLQHLGHIEIETAARLIQFNIDEIIYNRAIGRNLNTRTSDETSIFKDSEPDEYLRRAEAPDGAEAMDRFNAEGRMQVFHTHSVLAFIDVLFRAFPSLKFIHADRHPIDIVEDWYRRGWGERWDADPLAFSVIAKTDVGAVPWYGVDWAKDYQNMTPVERCAESVIRLQAHDREKLGSLDDDRRSQVYQFAFENLITETDSVIRDLSAFVGSEPHEKMGGLMESENCPSPIPVEHRRANLEKLQSESSQEIIDRLLAASRTYEKKWGLDPVS